MRAIRLREVLLRCIAEIFTSRCGGGRACCRKKAGIYPSPRTRLTPWLGGGGVRVQRYAQGDAGNGAQAEGDGHQVGDARRSMVRYLWRLESAVRHVPRRFHQADGG